MEMVVAIGIALLKTIGHIVVVFGAINWFFFVPYSLGRIATAFEKMAEKKGGSSC